jgi:hypothetical protein
VNDLPDYYAILGVPPTANRDEIRLAYRRLARRHHPDVNPPDEDNVAAAEFMRQLNAAYEVLNNPRQRAAYDRQRWAQAPPSRPRASYRPDPAWSPPPDDASWARQTGGGRWQEPKARRVVYEQPMPGWLESFFIIGQHLRERFEPLMTFISIMVPILVLSALLIFGFWAYNDIRNDPNAWGFLSCVVSAAGGVWVLVGVVGVVFMVFLVAWFAVWRAWNS